MALIGDIGNIFVSMFTNIFILAVFLIVVIAWAWVYLYLVRYKINVELIEIVGNDTQWGRTKAGIVYNRKRQRDELHILKSKMSALFAVFSDKFRWERPVPDPKYYHHTRKGRKFLAYLKVGELSTDLKPVQLHASSHTFRATDARIHDWLAQGLVEDARATRQSMDKWQKWVAVGSPLIMIGILFVFGLITYDAQQSALSTAKGISQDTVTTSENLVRAGQQLRGVQNVPVRNSDGSVRVPVSNQTNPAVDIAGRAGIDLR